MEWRLFFLFVLATCTQGEEICLSVDEDPYLLFGTKTAYIFGNRGIPNTRAHEVPGCQPIAFWSLNRHGSNVPKQEELAQLQKLADLKNNIATNYKNGNFRNTNQRICTADLNLLESWQLDKNVTAEGELTSDGYMSAQHLALAWKQKFPALLTNVKNNYLFKFVNNPIMRSTFRAYTEGIFGSQTQDVDVPKENDEKLVMPHKFCEKWKTEVGDNNKTLQQRDIFRSKQEFKDMMNNISLRLGFNYELEQNTIYSMYDMCRYNKAWDVTKISPWCSVFSHEDLKRLEFAEDLETYYKYGYGSELSEKIGCNLVKEMMQFFANHAENETPQQPKAIVQFTDYPLILMALTAMDARRDSAPITGDNFHTNTAQARKWSSSSMTPFNANLAAVLYKCSPNGNFQVKDEFQVLFLENEHPMYMEGCRVGLCEWSTVKEKFSKLDKCDIQFCNSASRLGGFFGVLFALSMLLLR